MSERKAATKAAFTVKRNAASRLETDRKVCRSHFAKRGGNEYDNRTNRQVCIAPDNPPQARQIAANSEAAEVIAQVSRAAQLSNESEPPHC